jgi:hypothetical protein
VFDASVPEALREVAHFDTFLAPAANSAGTNGAWGVYPFFPSGTVVISDISNGLFVLRDLATDFSQSAGRIGFDGVAAAASEGAGTVRITVRRNAGFAGAVSIDYATSDGTATAGNDYTAATGTLNWVAGDLGERNIDIALVNDATNEPTETFRMTLSNATGGAAIEGSATLDIQITNDDAAGPPGGGGGGRGGGGAADAWLLCLAGLLLFGSAARGRRVRIRGPAR